MWKIERIVSKGAYNYAVVIGHPNATINNYVLEHRIVMENFLGRLLLNTEIVHHKNENKKDNVPTNLEVTSLSEHSSRHGKTGRCMLKIKCPSCNRTFIKEKRQSHLIKGGIFAACSNSCRGKFSVRIQYEGRTNEIENLISSNILEEFIQL